MNFSTRTVTLTSLLRLINLSSWMTSEMLGEHCTDTIITLEISDALSFFNSFTASSGTAFSLIGRLGKFGQ